MLSISQVEKIADLSHIYLSEDEKVKYQKELSELLDFGKSLQNVSTDEVEPLFQVTGLEAKLREDVVVIYEGADKIVQKSPHGTEGRYFLLMNILARNT